MEKIWFISDDFGFKSYAEFYFQRDDLRSYIKENYEMTGLVTKKFFESQPQFNGKNEKLTGEWHQRSKNIA